MNTDFQTTLLTYINKFGGFVEKAVDAAMIELPLVIKEFLAWNFWESLVTGIVYLIAVILIVVAYFVFLSFLLKTRKRQKENSKGEVKTEEYSSIFNEIEDDGLKVFSILGILSGALLIILFSFSLLGDCFNNFKKALKIQIAPRVFLIEEARTIYQDIKKDK